MSSYPVPTSSRLLWTLLIGLTVDRLLWWSMPLVRPVVAAAWYAWWRRLPFLPKASATTGAGGGSAETTSATTSATTAASATTTSTVSVEPKYARESKVEMSEILLPNQADTHGPSTIRGFGRGGRGVVCVCV